MSFDIKNMHIPDNSLEAQAVEGVMNAHHVGAEEAVLSLLRNAADSRNPAQRMIGLFSSTEDSALTDSVMDLVADSRKTQTLCDIGL